jgi:tetratricopeptide (TPR) repeat protein
MRTPATPSAVPGEPASQETAITASDDEDAETPLSVGQRHDRLGEWKDDMAAYSRAIELDPNLIKARTALGRALLEKAKLAGAEERQGWLIESEGALKTVSDLAPLNPDLSCNLSKLYLAWVQLVEEDQQDELFEKALLYSDQALILSLDTTDLWNERAQVFVGMGDVEQAKAAYEESLAIDDKSAHTHLSIGKLYTAQAQWEDAVAAFSRGIELDPELTETYSNLGYVYSKMGSMEAALSAHSQAIESSPRDYRNHLMANPGFEGDLILTIRIAEQGGE